MGKPRLIFQENERKTAVKSGLKSGRFLDCRMGEISVTGATAIAYPYLGTVDGESVSFGRLRLKGVFESAGPQIRT